MNLVTIMICVPLVHISETCTNRLFVVRHFGLLAKSQFVVTAARRVVVAGVKTATVRASVIIRYRTRTI